MAGLIIGFIILGAIASACLITFWEGIRNWLNNTAANAVEKYLGYNARNFITKATSVIDKSMGMIRNKSIVYSKKNRLDTYYSKVTIEANADPKKIDTKVLRELEKNNGSLLQEFEYRG